MHKITKVKMNILARANYITSSYIRTGTGKPRKNMIRYILILLITCHSNFWTLEHKIKRDLLSGRLCITLSALVQNRVGLGRIGWQFKIQFKMQPQKLLQINY